MPPAQKWFTYYWLLCKRLGAEIYHTWRAELLASAVVLLFTYLLSVRENPAAWKDFRTALFATALTLGAFALWHLVRIPWLIHKRVSGREEIREHWGFGVFGVTVMAALLFGGYSLASSALEIRTIPVIIKMPAPAGPQIMMENPKVITRTLPASEQEKRCWVSHHFGLPNSTVPGSVTTTAVILRCSYKIEAPFQVAVEFDRDFIPGAMTLPDTAGWMGGNEVKSGNAITASVGSPALLAEQLVVVTVYGKTDQYPRAVRAAIKSLN